MNKVKKINEKEFSGMSSCQPLPETVEIFGNTIVFMYEEEMSSGQNIRGENGFVRFNSKGWVKVIYAVPPILETFLNLVQDEVVRKILIDFFKGDR